MLYGAVVPEDLTLFLFFFFLRFKSPQDTLCVFSHLYPSVILPSAFEANKSGCHIGGNGQGSENKEEPARDSSFWSALRAEKRGRTGGCFTLNCIQTITQRLDH